MTGLLVKDIRLFLKRKSALVVFVAVAAFLALSENSSFVVGYSTMLAAIMALSTVSYDDLDNGMTFIMTLPITKRDYATEKYIFTLSLALIGWLFSVVLSLGIGFVKKSAGVPMGEALAILPSIILVMAIMLPIQIKFGAERSRVILIIIIGFVVATAYVVSGFVSASFVNLEEKILPFFAAKLGVILLAVALIGIAISYASTIHILKQKSY